MVPCAYLRVFEPLDSFPAADRDRWRRYVADGNGVTVGTALDHEGRRAAARMIDRRSPLDGEAAIVRRVGDRIHVCPIQLAERYAVALLAFRELVPEPAIDAFVSEEEAREAVREVERLYRPPHIQEASWEVPLRWFAAFAPGERHFVDPPEGSGPRLTYLTTVRRAMDRLDRAVGIIEATIEDGDAVVASLTELLDWLASFDDDSLLELDYGGLTGVMSAADLVTDGSCDDVWSALEALERGDVDVATVGYEALTSRWFAMRTRTRLN